MRGYLLYITYYLCNADYLYNCSLFVPLQIFDLVLYIKICKMSWGFEDFWKVLRNFVQMCMICSIVYNLYNHGFFEQFRLFPQCIIYVLSKLSCTTYKNMLTVKDKKDDIYFNPTRDHEIAWMIHNHRNNLQ